MLILHAHSKKRKAIASLKTLKMMILIGKENREEQGLATPGLRPPSRGTTMYTPRPPDPRDLETLPYWRATLSLKINDTAFECFITCLVNTWEHFLSKRKLTMVRRRFILKSLETWGKIGTILN